MPSDNNIKSSDKTDISTSKFDEFVTMAHAVSVMLSLMLVSGYLGVLKYFLVVVTSFFIASERRRLFTDEWWYWFAYPSVLWCLVIYLSTHPLTR